MAYPLRIHGQQMEGWAKANIDFGATGKLDDLRCNALPAQDSALNKVWRRDLYDRGGGIGCICGLPARAARTAGFSQPRRQLRAVDGIERGDPRSS
jgi:hypothetical protein